MPLPPANPIPHHLTPLLSAVPSKDQDSLSLSQHPKQPLNSCSQLLFGLLHLPFMVYTHQQEMGPPTHTLGLGGKRHPLQRLIASSCSHPCQSFWPSSAPSWEQRDLCTFTLPATLLRKVAVKSHICILISNNHMFHLHCNFHLRS